MNLAIIPWLYHIVGHIPDISLVWWFGTFVIFPTNHQPVYIYIYIMYLLRSRYVPTDQLSDLSRTVVKEQFEPLVADPTKPNPSLSNVAGKYSN